MRVAVINTKRLKGHYDTFPIRVFRRQVTNLGIDVRFHHRGDVSGLSKCDVVFISSYEISRVVGSGKGATIQFLKALKQSNKVVIWFDTTDTANIAHPHVLPYVDRYVKEQLWKDRSLYQQSIYGGITFKQYYLDQFGVTESNGKFNTPVANDFLDKLRLGWNLSFADWRIQGKGRLQRATGIFFPRPTYNVKFHKSPLSEREFDVSYRAPLRGQAAVDFQRGKIQQMLSTIVADSNLKFILGERVSHKEYLAELNQSRVIPSPFGWGEICFRDLECFAAGAVLLKPDMGHLETYPELYIPSVTYIPFVWDFTDFETKLMNILDKPEEYQAIATEGQKRFANALSLNHQVESFSHHFVEIIREAMLD